MQLVFFIEMQKQIIYRRRYIRRGKFKDMPKDIHISILIYRDKHILKYICINLYIDIAIDTHIYLKEDTYKRADKDICKSIYRNMDRDIHVGIYIYCDFSEKSIWI